MTLYSVSSGSRQRTIPGLCPEAIVLPSGLMARLSELPHLTRSMAHHRGNRQRLDLSR